MKGIGLVYDPSSSKYDLFEDGKVVWSFRSKSKANEAINKLKQ